jgi:hypothetical protein
MIATTAKVQRTPVKPLCDVAKRMRRVRRNADLGRHADFVLVSECLGIRFAMWVKQLLPTFISRELPLRRGDIPIWPTFSARSSFLTERRRHVEVARCQRRLPQNIRLIVIVSV